MIACCSPRNSLQWRLSGWLLLTLCGLAFFGSAPHSWAAVRITEIMAENDGGLHDSDGESPDWIEIQNTGPAAVSLAGWHLSDTPTNLVRWTFPTTNLAPGAFLVVFASGKNRAVAGAELHTNFRLQNSGQYLALVEPDGQTVASAFEPSYPPQRRNVSFGIGSDVRIMPLLSPTATLKYIVPANSSLGSGWTGRTFSDATWTNAANGVGFDTSTQAGTVVLAVDFDERGVAPTTQPGFWSFVMNSNVNATTIQTNATARVFGGFSMTLSNTAPNGYDDRVRATPSDTGAFTQSALLRDHIMSRELTSTGGLDLTVTGFVPNRPYRVWVWSFDTGSSGNRVSDWYANGVQKIDNYTFNGTVLPTSNEQYQFSFDTTSTPAGAILVQGRRDLSSLANSPAVQINAVQFAEVGFGTNVATDLQAAMLGRNSTVFLRYRFTVADPAAVHYLSLRAWFDDGFAAYINGQLVASSNAPAVPAWDSAATQPHAAWSADEFRIQPGVLVAGENVLAIQAMNVGANDADFLFRAQLDAVATTDYTNRYFLPPTPGSVNATGYFGFVADTKFSVDRGYYSTPFSVGITSATPAVTIYWTTNGSVPSPTNGSVYAAPISVAGTSFLRAAGYAPGLIPTEVETHSYLFLEQVLSQPNSLPGYPTTWQASYPADYEMDPNVVYHGTYGTTISNDLRSLPAISIVMPHADLWGATTGIYRNSTSMGTDWEKACSVELIAPGGGTEFAINCGIEIHGNASRDNVRTPKHAFRLSFKSDYGPASLGYDWFGGQVAQFDRIVLRGLGFGDAWPTRYSDTTPVPGTGLIGLRYRPENSTYLKDTWIKESLLAMGHLATRSDFAHVYLNGLYWGLYNPSERIDAAFAASHLGGREMDWDVMAGDEAYNVAELRDGFRQDWDALIAQVNAGIGSEAAYQAILDKVDVVNLIDYMLVHGIAEMEDWPFHNWYAIHRRSTNSTPGTKWVFLPWDQEIGMDRYVRRDRVLAGADSDNTPGRLYTKLTAWPEFRRLYGDRVQKHLFNGGALSYSNCIGRFEKLGARIFQALVPESARWGDAREFTIGANPGTGQTFTRDEWWVPEMQQLYSGYFGDLHAKYIEIFQGNDLYPLTIAPELSQFGGSVPAGFLLTMSHANPDGSILFTLDGTDPRVYGSGAVAATAQVYSAPLPINAPTFIRARVLNSRGWSALVETAFYPAQDLSGLALTEIMFHPLGLGTTNSTDFEFLEFKNTGTNVLDLSGLTFSAGITYTFPFRTLLAQGSFLVLARNPAVFASRYPGVPVLGPYIGSLENGGETITLSHPSGATVLSVAYGDRSPWPVAADGYGFSLVQASVAPSQAPDDGNKWRASRSVHGSPGADDAANVIPAIYVSELLAHADLPLRDTVELFNPNPTNVNIGGWFLSDSFSEPRKYRFASGTIVTANGYRTFDTLQFDPEPGVLPGFSFSEFGEAICLASGDAATNLTGYSHGFNFQASDNGVSFGRVVNSAGEEFFVAQALRTLGANNSGPLVGPLVISEIQYHPLAGDAEFIEIQNISSQPVALCDPVATTNTWRVAGIGFNFPQGLVLTPAGFLLITSTNPADFRVKYGIPAEVTVLGPWAGTLQDSGERIQLEKPAAYDPLGSGWVVVDAVRYNDKAPWPPAADGTGPSLQRLSLGSFGDEPLNWYAAAPTPGTPNAQLDSDNDGMPDTWETAHGLDPNVAGDATEDYDKDGATNLQEYIAGTHPRDAASALRLGWLQDAIPLTLQFEAASNRTYVLEAAATLSAGVWTNACEWPAVLTDREITYPATNQPAMGLFFRLKVSR